MPLRRSMHSVSSFRAFRLWAAIFAVVAVLILAPHPLEITVWAQTAQDPGVRSGPPAAGAFFSTLTQDQKAVEGGFLRAFKEAHSVTQGAVGGAGLGPRYNSDECTACHAQPAPGGSAGFTNQAFLVYNLDGATNQIPSFENFTSAMLNARFPTQLGNPTIPDGSVHKVFTITGRADAGSCDIQQPDFSEAQSQNDLTFRIPTPMFGGGLLEIIQEKDILSNQAVQCAQVGTTGICGVPNYAEDGTVSRFGWKAQDRSALIFSSEAYNGEQGVTNESFPNETDETPGCVINGVPENHSNFSSGAPSSFPGDPERFALFIRFLAPPAPAPPNASTINGQQQFNNVGCNICHTQSFTTPVASIAALSQVQANLYSDIMLHHMGPCLADGVVQGGAAGDMFRTAPLWGVGQRIFFLHDGRTADIVTAVEDHFCNGNSTYPASEANSVVSAFNALSATNQQDLIDFLRSL